MPDVRGTAELYGGAYPPSGPFPVHPHDTHHYFTADGRAETDRTMIGLLGHRLRTTLRTV